MRKKGNLDEVVLQTLKSGALNVLEIQNSIKNSKDYKKTISKPKTFKETFIRLLRDNEILVSGYNIDSPNIDGKKIRSFNFNRLIFSVNKTDPLEIENLIFKCFFTDECDIKTRRDFKNSFMQKLNLIYNSRKNQWNKAFSNTYTEPLTDKVVLWLESERLLINNLQKEPWELNAEEYEKWIRYYMERLKSSSEPHHEIKSLQKKYKHYKIRFLENEVIDNLIPLHNPHKSRIFRMHHLVKDSELTDAEFLDNEIEVQGLKGKSDEEIEAYLVFTWPASDEKFIEWELGFSFPSRNTNDVENLFDEVMKYLKLKEPDKKEFITKLAYALSDDSESDILFNEIIEKVTGESL
ncbi:MAG: hypothetical protein ACC614_05320 [Methanobacterium formicicum]|jgi:hypothetical protein|uniref:hypothetical protein n=1 Tax=Methanobacterium formicicum TaxID=2162 RepID=UPI0035315E90